MLIDYICQSSAALIDIGDKTSDLGWRISSRESPLPDEREIVVEDIPFRKNPLYFPDLGRWYSRREVTYKFVQVFQNAALAQRGADSFASFLAGIEWSWMHDSIGDCRYTNVKLKSCNVTVSDTMATVEAVLYADPYRVVNGAVVL